MRPVVALALTVALGVTVSAAPSGAGPAAADNREPACGDLGDYRGADESAAVVTSAKLVPAAGDLPAYCLVLATIDDTIGIEVTLPIAQSWNQRFVHRGCGGACGLFLDQDPSWIAQGYAGATTDLGHKGGVLDFSWARGNREAETNFGYRATHLTTVVAKGMIKDFYGERPAYSYFHGVSTGGRQALVEAQRYPEDFDGIVSGSPALDETMVGTLHLLWSALAVRNADGSRILTPEDVRVLHRAVLAKCDSRKGVKDGVLDAPLSCNFDPASIKCSPRSSPRADCLTAKQVTAVKKMYDGPRTSTGERLTPGGLPRGSELEWIGNFVPTAEGVPSTYYTFGESFTKYAALEEDLPANWRPEDIDWDTIKPQLAYMEQTYSGTNSDLTRFRDSGGKLLLIHGWDDQSIPASFVTSYYERTRQVMGGRAATNKFFRLFMAPGANHYGTGAGVHRGTIDLLEEIRSWVEDDKAPTKLVGGHPDANGQIQFTRPMYPYPTTARWSGRGDSADAANWRPVEQRQPGGPKGR